MSFTDFWERNYPGIYPLSDEFKWCLKERWFRIHSLPEGKRYPTNKVEESEVLRRQNIVITDLVGTNNLFYLFINSCASQPGFPKWYKKVVNTHEFTVLPSLPLYELFPEEYPPDEGRTYLQQAVCESKWCPGMLDKLLLAIADDKVNGAIIINPVNNCLICPYDGGVDIILKDVQTRHSIRNKYVDWVSPYADWLYLHPGNPTVGETDAYFASCS